MSESYKTIKDFSRSINYAFNTILNHAENAHCNDLHHTTKQQHESGELCPAEYHLAKQAHIVREFLKTYRQNKGSKPESVSETLNS